MRPGFTRLNSTARSVSPAIERTPVRSIMRRRWFSTVKTLRPSSSATSLELLPEAMPVSTPRSRSVRGQVDSGRDISSRVRWTKRRPLSVVTKPPSATVRIASSISLKGAVFGRKPRAPPLSARRRATGVIAPESIRILVRGEARTTSSTTSGPCIPGKMESRISTSGDSRRHNSTADSASPPWPATRRSAAFSRAFASSPRSNS